MSAFEPWKNANGTYDGAQMFADLTSIPKEEILWMWARMKALKDAGLTADQVKVQVAIEGKTKPWESV
jgi:hypothetical protein